MKIKKKKSGAFMKISIAAIILLNIAFTVVCLFMFFEKGAEPAVLIGAWFGFTTVELWNMATIKKEKLKEGEAKDENGNF